MALTNDVLFLFAVVHEKLHGHERPPQPDPAGVRALLPAAPLREADGRRDPGRLGRGVQGLGRWAAVLAC